MSTEAELDVCVPETLRIPQLNGAPIWKLSMELFLSIAERLDSASCLTLSQVRAFYLCLLNMGSALPRHHTDAT
jgi:hypothetical protein